MSWSNVPQLAAAPAGPHADDLYAVWLDAKPGAGSRLLFARSSDKGATFTAPSVLSEQAEGGPAYDAFLPCVAVDEDGVVAVSWYDTATSRRAPRAGTCGLRVSFDGGATWRPSAA